MMRVSHRALAWCKLVLLLAFMIFTILPLVQMTALSFIVTLPLSLIHISEPRDS